VAGSREERRVGEEAAAEEKGRKEAWETQKENQKGPMIRSNSMNVMFPSGSKVPTTQKERTWVRKDPWKVQYPHFPNKSPTKQIRSTVAARAYSLFWKTSTTQRSNCEKHCLA
jgi:hypothetical protein